MTPDSERILAQAAAAEEESARRRDAAAAEWFVSLVENAARTHPERLIAALGRLFDLRAVLEDVRQVHEAVRHMAAADLRTLDWNARRVQVLHERLDKAARTFEQLAEVYRAMKARA